MKKSVLTNIGYRLIYGICYLVGLLPWWFLYYVVAEKIYFLLYYVARYRVGTVRKNLASSFPEKSEKELRKIEKRYYRTLSEYFMDAIDMASITPKKLLRRVEMPAENRAEVAKILQGRNSIVLMGHYGSWELMNAYGLHPDMPSMTSIYHPINNLALGKYYYKVRNRLRGLHSVSMKETLRFYIDHKDTGLDGRPFCIALVADQNAPIDAQSQWVRFLNHPTVFFHGGEKIARKFGIPVFFMHVEKLGRSKYRQTFELIWDGTSPTADHEITGTYVKLLEEEIRQVPELWLWSHRRWKRRPKGADAQQYNERYGTDLPE